MTLTQQIQRARDYIEKGYSAARVAEIVGIHPLTAWALKRANHG